MKKIMLILTVLIFAVPAVADTVTVTAVPDDANCTAEINYAVSDSNLPRAFALDITVDAGVIKSVDVTGAEPFQIYMGTIDINESTGLVDDYGSPIAPSGDLDALGGKDTNGITIEMGSLYEPGVDPAPDPCGLLIKVKCGGAPAINVSVAENTTRGGVVMEDVSITPTVNITGCALTCGCFPSGHDDYAEWQSVGEPPCWCYPRQCYGDSDDTKEGSVKAGYFYVGFNDLGLLINGWKKLEPPKGSGIAYIPNGICADFAHDQEGSVKAGYFRVGFNDLGILINNWKKLEPPMGSGVPTDCLDVP